MRVRLLHHEDMKVPEALARFAVKQGMWGFVKNIAPAFRVFAAERRTRVGRHDVDPQAYGHDTSANVYEEGRAAAATARGIEGAIGSARF